jgi:tRNA dimethylallyltransferase
VSAANRIRVGFIAGPTGVGKSAMALALAERLGAEIVNADSRQLYCGMDIGTAKPTAAERIRVPHHLIDIRDPDDPIDVARFRELARAAIAEIAARRVPVLVTGGSGLYLRVLRRGIFDGPGASAEIRRELMERAAANGVEALYHQLREVDPDAAARLEPRDLYRIIRALEVFRVTGVPISVHQQRHRGTMPEYDSVVIGLEMDRERLYVAINRRFREMVVAGLVDEVRKLLAAGYQPDAPPLCTIGYRHVAAHLRGELGLEAAITLAQRDTRRLAKRQLTWLRRDREVIWVDAEHGMQTALDNLGSFFAAPAAAATPADSARV